MRCPKLICLLLAFTLLVPAAPPPVRAVAPQQSTTPPSAQIRPELELFSGVIAYSGWDQQQPRAGVGNAYYRALKAYLAPYQEHEAIKVYQELLYTWWFTNDALPNFIFHLGPLPDLELQHEYSPYLIARAGGRENLERLRLALKELAADSQFQRFVDEWQPQYAEWSREAGLDSPKVTGWLEAFFGARPGSEFHTVLAPALFSATAYGATVATAEGKSLIYQVVLASPAASEKPQFMATISLETNALHEWAHSWVNPALERHPGRVQRLTPLFEPVRERMEQMAYPFVELYVNELVVRAVTALATDELYGPSYYSLTLEHERRVGFAPIERVVALLREYQANRAAYPTFDDFVPYLLDRLAGAAEIRPEMELLAGVLAHSDWEKHQRPEGAGNLYYQALKAYLEPYKEHEAVRQYNRMLKQGFGYNYPPAFILHLGPLPELELRYEYSDDLIKKAGGRENLERFRLALKDLAAASDFLGFTAEWQPRYTEWQQSAAFDANQVTDWLEAFFGEQGRKEFRMLLAPALFPGGGYGATATAQDGRQTVYQVVRADGRGEGDPVFPGGISLESLALHEWGHAFVNPALEAQPDQVRRLMPHFRPVRQAMSQQAYGSLQTFANEQVLRAVTTLAAAELFGPEAYGQELAHHEGRAFYLTARTVELLREYQADRNSYPTFDAFVPRLLEELAKESPAPGGANPLWPWAAGAGVALIAVASLLLVVRRRRRMAPLKEMMNRCDDAS